MSKLPGKYRQYVKSKISLLGLLSVVLALLLTLSIVQVSVLAASSYDQQLQSKQKNSCTDCSKDTDHELSPRDRFIAATYFSHMNSIPDDDEPLEVLQGHVKAQELLLAEKNDEAVTLLQALVKKYPDARHANEGLAIALKERYNKEGDINDLHASTEYFAKAIKKAIQVNVLPLISMQVGVDLGKLGQMEQLNSIFEELDKHFPDNDLVALDYARGLAAANDPKAEDWFKKAISLCEENGAPVEYGEWLLDRERYSDALVVLDPKLDPYEGDRFLHFLRGYALERLGQEDKARLEYDKVKKLLAPGSMLQFKSKYRIESSPLQKGLNFEGVGQARIDCEGMTNLRKMVMCEAEGESIGGKRAVAWVARNRVFNGSRDCVTVNNAGSDNCEKYNSVVTQSGQFNYRCGKTPNQQAIDAAEDVWAGWAPEPSQGRCKGGGGYSGDKCTGRCKKSSYQGGYSDGDMMFYSTTGLCSATHPFADCTSKHDKVCGNGGSDHCFYWVPKP